MEQEKNVCCQNMPVWKILGAILTIFLVVFISVLTWNEIKKHDYIGRENQQIYTISISGEGKVNATPDIAQISLGLQTEKIEVAQAQKENTEKMNNIIKEIKAMGVEAKDIATENYSIYPRYDWTSGRQVLKGYQVSQNVTVKIRDLAKIGDIVDKAGKLGANQVGSLSFTIDEPEKLKQQAREKALVNAKEKAEALAKIAGVKLGKLVAFTETSSGGVTPVYRDYAMKSLDAVGAGEAMPAPQIEAGSQDIIIDVMVTYEVL
ncbi:MAG: SIMPL domain-containing protein [Candidatus Buchananbacteria bacterium]